VIDWTPARVAAATGARLLAEVRGPAAGHGPRRVSIDSRTVQAGDLFVGLRGEHRNGGEYARQALQAGAWGVLVTPPHAREAARESQGVVVLTHPDPLVGLQTLAREWLRELKAGGARVVAITGSTGKTSTKDILAALLDGELRTVASPENLNTEIGLPLVVLAAPTGTQALVLEMAMRGKGQIAELAAIAEPDVGMIVNVGPVHLELLGSLEAIAAAKAELIEALGPGTTAVLPAGEPLLEPHRRADVRTITFGGGGDVELLERRADGVVIADRTTIDTRARQIELRPTFSQHHNLENLLAAVAAARALGVTPRGAVEVRFSALRGERKELPGGITLIDDCYNANPMSMRAAVDELAETAARRRVAVLGDMLELGREELRFHRELGSYAAARGIDMLVTVGPLAREIATTFAGAPRELHLVEDAAAAAELLRGALREGDTVLVKGSRGVGLERVAQSLTEGTGGGAEGTGGGAESASGGAAGPSASAATPAGRR
jgi:UDP-N-acetylmuramoyl-tripeptide--D-alanyl-D-alanine ligase